jgi:large subunit ribosomal protein L23
VLNPADVLIAPVISEKSSLAKMDNRYCFWVNLRANKLMVKEAVAKAFGVKAVSVNIVSVHPKNKRVGHSMGMTENRKKAYVTLAAGQKIAKLENAGG